MAKVIAAVTLVSYPALDSVCAMADATPGQPTIYLSQK